LGCLALNVIGWYTFNKAENVSELSIKLEDARGHADQADMMHDAVYGDVLLSMLINDGVVELSEDEFMAGLNENTTTFRSELDAILAIEGLPEDAYAAVNDAETTLNTYLSEATRIGALAFEDVDQARGEIEGFRQTYESLVPFMENISSTMSELADAERTALSDTFSSGRTSQTLVGMVMILATIAVAVVVVSSIRRRTAELSVRIEALRRGDLRGRHHDFGRGRHRGRM
jgi:hypothetical protein